MSQRIAIYGGTFDPIHYGHLRSIDELAERMDFDEVRLVPSFLPPHREKPGASAEQRVAMLKLAIKEFPALGIDEREVHREGASYTVETLEEIRQELGIDATLIFVLGADAFALLHTWHRWQDLTKYANVVIMQRPGSREAPKAQVVRWMQARLCKTPPRFSGTCGEISEVTLTQHDISATQIRARCTADISSSDWLPEPVLAYIKQHKLYKN